MLPKLLIDLRVLDVLKILDSMPVRIVPGDARHDEAEELVIGEYILFGQALVDNVVDCASRGGPPVVLGELSFEPVFYCGTLIGVCWHIF